MPLIKSLNSRSTAKVRARAIALGASIGKSTDAEVIRYYREGIIIREITNLTGWSAVMIYRILKRNGIPTLRS